ncbi:endoplasmic reticulum membrane-associated RNA degradation protein-like [Branchiostoma lanceolatum]|uniref:endoplasmic reticulum membrane-associated RNA degradation protein-like n=1 Tax=Branchiostoma lanceolatum TaxID=7740 RepID=UPI0034513D30
MSTTSEQLGQLEQDSSLSVNVQRLVCEVGLQDTDASDEHSDWHLYMTDEGTLRWEAVERTLHQASSEGTNVPDYHTAVSRLAPVCRAVHAYLSQLSPAERRRKYSPHLTWTGYGQLFEECFDLLSTSDQTDRTLSLLQATAALERALGDVFLMNGTQCPSLLKDLLATRELTEIFGCTAMSCLHILIGPPSSLNLRNIAWHGFLSPGEVPDMFVSFLLVVVTTLGMQAPFLYEVSHRNPLDLSPQLQQLQKVFPVLQVTDLPILRDVIHRTAFIQPSMVPYWEKALEKFSDQSYGHCLLLLLPQLEHGLRRVFAVVNNCPQRMLTAESSVLYTTFDEILSPTLQDGSTNHMSSELGDSYMEVLLDLLVHTEGPRVRDHASHGELDLTTIPAVLANHVLCVCLAFCVKYASTDTSVLSGTAVHVEQVVQRYKSLFHPTALLVQRVYSCLDSMSTWLQVPRPSAGELKGDHAKPSEEAANNPHTMKVVSGVNMALYKVLPSHNPDSTLADLSTPNSWQVYETPMRACLCEPVKTVYRPRGELEMVSLLRHIMDNSQTASQNIQGTAEQRCELWRNRQLRSRQRENYARMLDSLQTVFNGLQLVVMVTVHHLLTLGDLSRSRIESSQKRKQRKFLKSILQYVENLVSKTSMDQNKWDECCTLTSATINRITEYYNDNILTEHTASF